MKKSKKFLGLGCLTTLILFCVNLTVFAEERLLVPVGRAIGITVNIKGVSVINTAGFETEDGSVCSPAADAGISADDIILKIDGCEISSADDLEKLTNKSENGELSVVYEHGGEEKQTLVRARKDTNGGRYRIGVWIKDSASGIGTITYYDPKSKFFGALGHGICGSGGKTINVSGGNVLRAEVTSVRRGEKGAPGELLGIFGEDGNIIGNVLKNTDEGVFGKILNEDGLPKEAIPVAERNEVHEGDASILCNVEGENICEYSVKIIKINDDENSSKGMIVKITDPKLIEKTGGIVQGMSGSPLIQDSKLVGAVTHVFVNNPTRGYAIFIEKMEEPAN